VQWVDIMAREQATVLTCVPCDVICAAAHTPWLLFTSCCIFKVDVCGFRSPAGFGPKLGFDFLCGRQTRIVHPDFRAHKERQWTQMDSIKCRMFS